MIPWFNSYVYSVFVSTSNFARFIDGIGISDVVNSIATDSSGNLYIAGTYSNTAYISTPFYGTVSGLPLSAGSSVAFVSKFDSSGTYQWSRIIDSAGADTGERVACDSSGNVYLAGSYDGTPSIKTQGGTVLATLPTDLGGTAAFVAKFDSSGTYQYSRTVDGTGNDSGEGVAVDSSGNVYLAGYYGASAAVAPFIRTASNANVFSNVATIPPSLGSNAAFVAKFDSTGNYQYTRIVDGASGNEFGVSAACDSSGNMYLAGYYGSAAPFVRTASNANVFANVATLPGNLGVFAAFVAKFDSTGTYQYTRIVDGVSGAENGYSVKCDSSGNMYFGGEYRSATTFIRTASNANVFSNIATLPTLIGTIGAFLSKFDSSGTYQYSRIVDGTSWGLGGYDISFDSSGNVYYVGEYNGTTGYIRTASNANVFSNIATLPSDLGGTGAIVSKFDSTGTYQYSRIVDGTTTSTSETGYAVACDSSDNLYFGGSYIGTDVYVRTASNANVFANIATFPTSSNVAGFVIKFTSNGSYTAPTAPSTFARIVDGVGTEIGYSVACDSSGNVYLTGQYSGTPSIEDHNGNTIATLPISLGASAGFVSKFNSSGTYQYTRIVDGSGGNEVVYGVVCDSSGNVYLAGEYGTGTVVVRTVDSSNNFANVATLPTSLGGSSAFVSKFDSSGTYQYSRIVDGSSSDQGNSVACDSSGNVYLAGYYSTGTMVVRTADSSNNFANVAILPESLGGIAAFVSKFDSSGTYQYSRIVDATVATNEIGNGVACDSSGNMYFVGVLTATSGSIFVRTADSSNNFANVATLPLVLGGTSAFVSKFDSSGTYQYSRIIDGASNNEQGSSVACDSSGNMYFSGYYASSAPVIRTVNAANAFANVATLPVTIGSQAGFVAKFDSSGTYQYSRIIDGSNNENANFVVCDSNGNIYVAGSYVSGITFIRTASNANTFANVAILPTPSNGAAFFSKFDSSGDYQYSRIIDSTSSSNDIGYGITIEPTTQNVYFTGLYNATPTLKNDFNITLGTLPASSGSSAAFLLKFNPDGSYSPQ